MLRLEIGVSVQYFEGQVTENLSESSDRESVGKGMTDEYTREPRSFSGHVSISFPLFAKADDIAHCLLPIVVV